MRSEKADSTPWPDLWAPWIIKNDLNGGFLDCGEKPFDGEVAGLAWDGEPLWALDAKKNRICVIAKALAAEDGGRVPHGR